MTYRYYVCGLLAGDDGQWHNGGYGASAYKCENCRFAANFYKVEGRKTRYRCKKCVQLAPDIQRGASAQGGDA